MIIEDGTGNGYQVKISDENALKIVGETHHIQHHFSKIKGQTFQLLSTLSFNASGSHSLIHIKNTSASLLLGITYIRLQGVGFSSLPSENDYISIGGDTTYSSGGTTITPINMNFKSGNVADIIAYKDSTVTGTLSEIDRWYIKDNGTEERYEKWGSILLGQNNTFEVVLNTINTSGTFKTRITFCMISGEI